MGPKFNINDLETHTETRETYKVIEGKHQFFYKIVETNEEITIDPPFAEGVLEIVN